MGDVQGSGVISYPSCCYKADSGWGEASHMYSIPFNHILHSHLATLTYSQDSRNSPTEVTARVCPDYGIKSPTYNLKPIQEMWSKLTPDWSVWIWNCCEHMGQMWDADRSIKIEVNTLLFFHALNCKCAYIRNRCPLKTCPEKNRLKKV